MEIWNKGVDDAFHSGKSAAMEGAHMYKIDGMYYILCPAGGTAGWQVCLRSKNIYGPYEHKVVLQDDSSYPENASIREAWCSSETANGGSSSCRTAEP